MKQQRNKVAFFCPALQGGGAERVMLTLAEEFANNGVEVDFIVSRAEGALLSQVPSNVNFINFNKARLIFSIGKLVSYLKKNKPDVLLSALEHANFAAIMARIASRYKGVLAISLHNTISRKESTKNIKSYILKKILLRMNRYVDVTVAVSSGVADDYAKYMNMERNKISVIYNPAVKDELYELANEECTHKWLKNKLVPVILAVGRLTKHKDYPTLLESFRLVRQQVDAKLIILGEGEERYSLEQLIKDKQLTEYVSLSGFEGNPYAYMKQSDVFVLSSISEGFGLVLAEALAIGVPVISTDCDNGPREILESGKWGRLVPVNDPEMLSKAIIDVIHNPTLNEGLVRARDFHVDKIVLEYAKQFGIELSNRI